MGTLLNRRWYMGGVFEKPETRLVCVYNVTDGSVNTTIVPSSKASSLSSVEIDGVAQQTVSYEYPLSTGEHVVKIMLTNMVTMPDGIFQNVTALTECRIPSSFTSIGASAFAGSGLEKIYIPSSITVIKNHSFNANSLKEVHIEDIGAWCRIDIRYNNAGTNPLNKAHHLYINGTEIIDLIVPSGITSLTKTFWGASSIRSAQLPDSITNIGPYAFSSCGSLTTINIPEGVTSIGSMGFDEAKISVLTLPSTLTTIGDYAFRNNSTMSSMTCLATTPPTIGSMTFYRTNGCPIYVPATSVETYKAAQNWSSMSSRIQAIPT